LKLENLSPWGLPGSDSVAACRASIGRPGRRCPAADLPRIRPGRQPCLNPPPPSLSPGRHRRLGVQQVSAESPQAERRRCAVSRALFSAPLHRPPFLSAKPSRATSSSVASRATWSSSVAPVPSYADPPPHRPSDPAKPPAEASPSITDSSSPVTARRRRDAAELCRLSPSAGRSSAAIPTSARARRSEPPLRAVRCKMELPHLTRPHGTLGRAAHGRWRALAGATAAPGCQGGACACCALRDAWEASWARPRRPSRHGLWPAYCSRLWAAKLQCEQGGGNIPAHVAFKFFSISD
jgi:hypothetical protein